MTSQWIWYNIRIAMAEIPTTSTTLLRDLAKDSQHARWGEFVARYRPMMEAFMRERFPSLDADDVIQETLVELIKVFPVYHYSPKEKGHFHNYLTGILRHRAFRMMEDDARRKRIAGGSRTDCPRPGEESGDMEWRGALLEIALQQLLADSSIHERTRLVFARVAVNGEKPSDVAAAFGIERNAVDQMKSRMMARLKELVAALEKVDEA